ncbi:MAG: hypothetical protein ACXVO9_07105 [Bacteroidia bacterium]
MRYYKHLFFLFVFFTSLQVNSQTNPGTKKIYSYSFEGNIPAENIQLFEQRVSQLNFVKMAKLKYKSQAQKGELIIEVEEPVKSYEGANGFDLIELKKLIQSYNLSPNELKLLQN